MLIFHQILRANIKRNVWQSGYENHDFHQEVKSRLHVELKFVFPSLVLSTIWNIHLNCLRADIIPARFFFLFVYCYCNVGFYRNWPALARKRKHSNKVEIDEVTNRRCREVLQPHVLSVSSFQRKSIYFPQRAYYSWNLILCLNVLYQLIIW